MITRFAPAPTGFLHLGHVVNAIFVWGLARARGGTVVLRIEDHDRQRSRREYEAAILEDLEWLGFVADEGPVRQSERDEIYRAALASLRSRGLGDACSCSRAEILGAAGAGPTLRYAGTCRQRRLSEGPGLGVRVRLEPSVERFIDERHGPQEQRPFDQCGDLLLRDRYGNWTYQFAATVDDDVQRITDVIRGDDLLDSTGRQIQLARLLGRAEPPRFFHHPLIMKSATEKLSKSDRDTGVCELRTRGWTSAAVIGHAARLAGLIEDNRDLPAGDVSTIMSIFTHRA